MLLIIPAFITLIEYGSASGQDAMHLCLKTWVGQGHSSHTVAPAPLHSGNYYSLLCCSTAHDSMSHRVVPCNASKQLHHSHIRLRACWPAPEGYFPLPNGCHPCGLSSIANRGKNPCPSVLQSAALHGRDLSTGAQGTNPNRPIRSASLYPSASAQLCILMRSRSCPVRYYQNQCGRISALRASLIWPRCHPHPRCLLPRARRPRTVARLPSALGPL